MSELDYTYHKMKCKCGRKVLVESVLFGVDHTASIVVTCDECLKKLKVGKKFTKEHPDAAKDIEEWIASE